ncbi:MAG: ATP-binding protein [bacterium]
MINKKIEEIKETDLQALIDNKVLEGKTIEYKKEMPNDSDSSKKEFLADVTSLANSSGGDLIFGIEQDNQTGEPKSLNGIETKNIDNEKTRLDNIVRGGIEPRILSVTIKPIFLGNSRYAILIRIPKSWVSPHRVIFGGHAKFYARNSSGKYEMDVDELRVAFNLSETLTDRIRNFRADRVAKIQADETPVPLGSPHRVVLHLIHGNALNLSVKFDVNSIYASRHDKLPLIYRSTLNGRYNLDGLFTYSNADDGKHSAHTQLYRNGIIEAVDAQMLAPIERNGVILKYISSVVFEEKLIQATTRYLNLMSELAIEPPIFIFLSLLNVKDYKILTSGGAFGEYSDSIDRNMLLLPAEIVEAYGIPAETILKPMFDLVWNACGEPKSLNFDENDHRIVR